MDGAGNEGLPYLDEVWTYPLENSTNRSAALLAGNVDYAQTINPEAYQPAPASPVGMSSGISGARAAPHQKQISDIDKSNGTP